MRTVVLKRMVKGEGIVRFSNISLDLKGNKFSLLLGIKSYGQRKFREELVSGFATVDMLNWFTKSSAVKVRLEDGSYVSTGDFKTGFQKYLISIGKSDVKLFDLVFEASNLSDDYYSCPFKLIRYVDGNNTLTKVNIAGRKPVVSYDPNTGLETKEFVKKYAKLGDNFVPVFHDKKSYVRLLVQEEYTANVQ